MKTITKINKLKESNIQINKRLLNKYYNYKDIIKNSKIKNQKVKVT